MYIGTWVGMKIGTWVGVLIGTWVGRYVDWYLGGIQTHLHWALHGRHQSLISSSGSR